MESLSFLLNGYFNLLLILWLAIFNNTWILLRAVLLTLSLSCFNKLALSEVPCSENIILL
jgi:hypothetical protein